ncbi:hypothetical protein TNCV_322571 [Trichonephila clavipes]|nr:hypothetical protein TNCV_322571 [Trichonephila clavipes]
MYYALNSFTTPCISALGGFEVNCKSLLRALRRNPKYLHFLKNWRLRFESNYLKRIFHSSDFAMSSLEQRAHIKFCVLLEKSPETLEMLKKAYGNYSSTGGLLAVLQG